MLETKPSNIRLERAVLCLDCENIGDNPKQCNNCSSKAVHPLARFLNRQNQTPMVIPPFSTFWVDWFESLRNAHYRD